MRLPAFLLGVSMILGALAVPSTAKAEDGRIGIGGDLVLMVPVGKLSDATGVLLGPVAHGGYRILPPLELTARIGYLFGFNKDQGNGVSTSVSDLPIWAGARYFFLDPDAGPYGAGELGFNILHSSGSSGGISASETNARFGFNLAAGYVISKELPIDLKAQFSFLNLLGQSDGEKAALGIALSAGYTYQF